MAIPRTVRRIKAFPFRKLVTLHFFCGGESKGSWDPSHSATSSELSLVWGNILFQVGSPHKSEKKKQHISFKQLLVLMIERTENLFL